MIWRRGQPGTVRAAAAAAVLMAATAVGAETPARPAAKPKVPIGVDPGGVAVAVIGDGIDYTRPEVVSRLARDGEGFIVGFDVVDRDRQPYAAAPPEGTCGTAPAAASCTREHPAWTVLREAPRARIGIFRVAPDDPRQTAEAIAMIAQSPARIVLLQRAPPVDLLREAARRFPQLSFKVPAPVGGYPPDIAASANVAVGCVEGPPAATAPASPPDGSATVPASCRSAATLAVLAAADAARPGKP